MRRRFVSLYVLGATAVMLAASAVPALASTWMRR
jgi:hypothetical protein